MQWNQNSCFLINHTTSTHNATLIVLNCHSSPLQLLALLLVQIPLDLSIDPAAICPVLPHGRYNLQLKYITPGNNSAGDLLSKQICYIIHNVS